MSKLAAERAFSSAGLSPRDVQVVELHDCFSANELITYEALGGVNWGRAPWVRFGTGSVWIVRTCSVGLVWVGRSRLVCDGLRGLLFQLFPP